ncbi:hypothetical protein IAG41_06135 [Sphingomonas sp. JC676]|uniref:hypothetical protein n=1 Tax=Sphingomonas sp. JC676 TaxID=2768065 RepID=UPI001657FE24|nr:hypothetical protein [Sphingomonas sp. JC676]MBC9031965.1 hypothetical protein [Sphingomonas sp. JC676]
MSEQPAWVALLGCTLAICCIVQAVVDFRRKRYVWSAFGFLFGMTLMLTPVESRVTITLPASAPAD